MNNFIKYFLIFSVSLGVSFFCGALSEIGFVIYFICIFLFSTFYPVVFIGKGYKFIEIMVFEIVVLVQLLLFVLVEYFNYSKDVIELYVLMPVFLFLFVVSSVGFIIIFLILKYSKDASRCH